MSNETLDWDSEIENDGSSYVTLPEDTECTFTVLMMDKGRSENKGCPMAILQIEVVAIDGSGKNKIRENLVLHRDSEWRLCNFFTAIGQRKHGERLKPDWSKVPLAKGRCTVGIEKWKKREDPVDKDDWTGFSNKIKKYLDPVEGQAPADGEEPSFA